MRTIAVVCAVLVLSCVSTVRRLDPQWDGTTPPQCTESYGAPVVDGVIGGIMLGVGIGAANRSVAAHDSGADNNTADVLAIAGLVGGLIFGIASWAGEESVRDCRSAMIAWRIGGAVNARQERPQQQQKVRGFYCASSASAPAAGFCQHTMAGCERVRAESLPATSDLSDCDSASSAFCFAPARGEPLHCFGDAAGCNAERDDVVRSAGDRGAVGICTETR